jgi:hypothetical protein
MDRAARRAGQAYPEIAATDPEALFEVIAQDPEIIAMMEKADQDKVRADAADLCEKYATPTST